MTTDADIKALKATLLKTIGENDAGGKIEGWISTGFAPLNMRLSGRYDGGYGYKRLYEMFGPSSAGKTILATKAMIAAQEAGGVAIFIDYEQSFDEMLGAELGLNTESPYFIYKMPRTWEEGNMMAVQAAEVIRDSGVIHEDAPIFIVQDSIAAAVPESQAAKGAEFDKLNMNDTTALARVASTTLKSIKMYANDFNFTCLYLNQIRTSPGVMFGNPETTPGGKAMEFYSSGRIRLSRAKEVDKKVGLLSQEITATVVKSKHTRPMQHAKWKLNFREDGVAWFDTERSTLEYMRSNDLIEVAGNNIVWDGKKVSCKVAGQTIRDTGTQQTLMDILLKADDDA